MSPISDDIPPDEFSRLQTQVEKLDAQLIEERAARVAAETLATTTEEQLGKLQGQVDSQAKTIDELQSQLRTQEGELGGLRVTAARVDALEDELPALRAERDALLQKVADLEAQAAQAAKDREADKAAWNQERQKLQVEIDALKAAAAAVPPVDLPAKQLAQDFLGVFEELATPRRVEGQAFSAALTGLEVEAKVGVAQVKPAPQEEPELVLKTVDPATALPDTLSTVRMKFGIVPGIVAEE